ncbi:MAG: TolC family protein [Ignavibacteriales bacterium]|nr:MAG: TolC family protein [Ignavibacteriales bacterium]
MKYIFFAIVLSGCVMAQSLTLEESLQLGLKNSKDLVISKSKTKYADAKITEVGSQMLPQLKFSASYTRLSDVPPFEVIVPFSPSPIKIQDVILNNYSFKLSLQQPLFTGFRLSSLKNSAEYNYEAANLEYNAAINNYAVQIYESFWNFYNSQQIAVLIKEQLISINQHLADTKNFLDNGLATMNDVLKLEVQYSSLELKLIEAESNLDLARINFNRVIGLELDASPELKVNEINPLPEKFLISDLLLEANKNRDEIKSISNRVKASDELVSAANAGWFPSIYLFGNAYYNNPNQRIMPIKNEFKDSWDAGVTLNWDLWNWGYTSSQTTQAEEIKLQTETNLAQLKESIEIEVTREYLNYVKSIKKVEVARKSVEQADENYRLTKEKYNSQVASSSDLIDAQTYQLEAETNLISALVGFQISKVKLERATGRKIY